MHLKVTLIVYIQDRGNGNGNKVSRSPHTNQAQIGWTAKHSRLKRFEFQATAMLK